MITTDLAKHLRTRKAIRDNAEVFRGRIPEGHEGVAVVVNQFGGNPLYHLRGESTLSQASVQVSVVAGDTNTHTLTDDVATAVLDTISGYTGTMGDANVKGCTLERKDTLNLPPDAWSDDWSYEVSMDFLIHYDQPAVTYSRVNRELGNLNSEAAENLVTEDGIPIFQELSPT